MLSLKPITQLATRKPLSSLQERYGLELQRLSLHLPTLVLHPSDLPILHNS
jgi:hypothetical protein